MAYQTQPGATAPMTVGGGNRNSKNLPIDGDGREWSNGFFDCLADVPTCIMAWCLPCVVFGQVKKRVEHLETKGTPDPDHGGFVSSDCIIHGCLLGCGCGFIMQMGVRGKVRQRYNIKGSGASDCFAACCCTPCELVQESREIELEEQSFGGKH